MTFTQILTYWYSNNKRDFPWRRTNDPYFIWLSEIILQQTQIKQGLPYYQAFTSKYPSVFELAKVSESEVLKLWQGLGYYSRARNLHATAKYIVDELEGVFPNNYNDLIKLKGIGDYTASAIASICYNEPKAVVDGNVYRVLSRYYGIEIPINSTKGIKEFKNLAQKLIDIKNPGDYNQAIMEFGAVICRPNNPTCNTCPLNHKCVALQRRKIDTLPVKLKSKKVKKRYFNFLVVVSNNGKTILEKRNGKDIWQNLYQFPLIESNESLGHGSIEQLARDHQFLSNKSFDLSLYNKNEIVHKLSHQHLYTKFWIVSVDELSNDHIAYSEIEEYAVPVLIENFLETFNF